MLTGVYLIKSDKNKFYRAVGKEEYKGHFFDLEAKSHKSRMSAKSAYMRKLQQKKDEIDGLTGDLSIKEGLPKWFNTFEVPTKKRTKSTLKDYESTINQICNSPLGKLKATSVTREQLQEYFNSIQYLYDGGIKKRWQILSKYFKYVYLERQNQNPMTKIKRSISKREKKEMDALTDKQAIILTNQLLANSTGKIKNGLKGSFKHGDVLAIQLWHFLRYGEVVALRKKDIDFRNNVIHITRQWVEKEKIFREPKYNSVRDVPINNTVRDVIIRRMFGKNDDDLLFATVNNTVPNERLINQTLHKCCMMANIPDRTSHTLRHDGISYYVRKGVSIETMRKTAGHKDIQTTMKYYRGTPTIDPVDVAIMQQSAIG